MKILFLCTFYHRALLFRQQMDALNERGHYVRAFNSVQYGEEIAEKFKPIMDDQVVHCECWNKTDRLFFFPRQWKTEKLLEKTYDLADFDLMHAHMLVGSGYTARRMKRKHGLKYVASIRVTDLIGFIRLPFFRQMAIKNAEEASGLLFLSKCHKAEFMDKFVPESKRASFEEKSAVIGNALEKYWEENTAEPRVKRRVDTVRVLLVARIIKAKNIPAAANAVKRLREKGIDATLTVVGKAEDQGELKKLERFDFLTLLPFMPREELREIYGNHDIFLLPSKVETFGRVYIEAMSQGLPVLYSRGQGFDEVFPDGEVGFSVPCDDADYTARKIEEILSDYERISANCIRCVKDFYEDAIIDKLEQFYTSALLR